MKKSLLTLLLSGLSLLSFSQGNLENNKDSILNKIYKERTFCNSDYSKFFYSLKFDDKTNCLVYFYDFNLNGIFEVAAAFKVNKEYLYESEKKNLKFIEPFAKVVLIDEDENFVYEKTLIDWGGNNSLGLLLEQSNVFIDKNIIYIRQSGE